MIEYINQDITTVKRGVIAHGCNTQGVMGAGVAKFLRNKYPSIFPRYHQICEKANSLGTEDELLGRVNFVIINPNVIVANCFTQHLGKLINGKIADPDSIRDSLTKTLYVALALELPVYIPKIGAGLGGLDWETDVEPIVKDLVNMFGDTTIYVCVWP